MVGIDTGAMGTVATVAGPIRYFPEVILPRHPRGSSCLIEQSLFCLSEIKEIRDMKIEQWKIGDVKPYENNPRINDAAVDAVAASIQEFGFRQPIVERGLRVQV